MQAFSEAARRPGSESAANAVDLPNVPFVASAPAHEVREAMLSR